tara:strand:- start:449 stop:595 length:147 start_codon:yes stop_codon:yes gene_type:complete
MIEKIEIKMEKSEIRAGSLDDLFLKIDLKNLLTKKNIKFIHLSNEGII